MTTARDLVVPDVDARGARIRPQLHRVLWLIRRLDQGWQNQYELAAQCIVTTRTIRRDIGFLRSHGFVIEERKAHVSDSQALEWRLTEWPATYDLTVGGRERWDA